MMRGGLRRISPIGGNVNRLLFVWNATPGIYQPDQAIVFGYPVRRRSPRLIFRVVGQSRDDVLTAVPRREAINPGSQQLTASPRIPI
jgi:hypothetical protein